MNTTHNPPVGLWILSPSLTPFLVSLCLLVLPLSAVAGVTPTDQKGRWWGALELGAGHLHRTVPGLSDSSTRFCLGFEGGLAVSPEVLLGVELSGWTIHAANNWNPAQGSGIEQLFAVAKFYPQPDFPLRLHVGAGTLAGWDNSPGGKRRSGSGWEAGLEYERALNARSSFAPFLRYVNGKAGNMKLSALNLGVEFMWR